MQLLGLLSIPLLVVSSVSAEYFVTKGKFKDISNEEAICGAGNKIAMANDYNLKAFNAILSACGITTAFVSGWNGESRVQLRFTLGSGGAGTVTPNNDCLPHNVLCSGDPTSCPVGVIAVGRAKVAEPIRAKVSPQKKGCQL